MFTSTEPIFIFYNIANNDNALRRKLFRQIRRLNTVETSYKGVTDDNKSREEAFEGPVIYLLPFTLHASVSILRDAC